MSEHAAEAATVFASLDEVRAAVGKALGTSDWVQVGPERVEQFARATGDPAAAGGERVPEHLVLSLTNQLLPQIVEVRGASMGVNYGTGPVRFPGPAPVGARLRASAELTACDEVRGGIQTTIRVTVEVAGRDAPACVVDALSRWLA